MAVAAAATATAADARGFEALNSSNVLGGDSGNGGGCGGNIDDSKCLRIGGIDPFCCPNPAAMEDAFPSYSSGSTDQLAAKRRGTRRHRNVPPASANTASSSASSTEESGFTDEEGMANCLILLAQGGGGGATTAGKFKSKRFTETETTAGGRAGFYVYECKTCNKCFPSFQALGGHRASHKKLKMAAAAEVINKGDHEVSVMSSVQNKRVDGGGKGKVHECSICGSEFSSGQALGGHMRRHRPAVEVAEEFKKERNGVLGLDLNLPAPVEDDGSSLGIAGNKIVFSPPAAALVDCYY